MHRNVTAIYRNYATADLVKSEVSKIGISSGDIHVIPNKEETVEARGSYNERYMDDLHDLHLPDEDLRTYQQSVRRGDYVVSVEVDEDKLTRVQEIMSRPEEETYDLDARHEEFRDAQPYPRKREADLDENTGWAGRRDQTNDDPYARTYERDARLKERREQ